MWACSAWGSWVKDGFRSTGLGGTVVDSGQFRGWTGAEGGSQLKRDRVFFPCGLSGMGRWSSCRGFWEDHLFFQRLGGLEATPALMGETARSLGGRRRQERGDGTGPQVSGSRVTTREEDRSKGQGWLWWGAEPLEHLLFSLWDLERAHWLGQGVLGRGCFRDGALDVNPSCATH